MQIRFPPCWCPCKVWICIQIYGISKRHDQSLQIIHLSNEYFQESDPKSQDEIPVLSFYGKNLECYVRECYLKKISVVGVSAIPSEKFSSECLPPIEVLD